MQINPTFYLGNPNTIYTSFNNLAKRTLNDFLTFKLNINDYDCEKDFINSHNDYRLSCIIKSNTGYNDSNISTYLTLYKYTYNKLYYSGVEMKIRTPEYYSSTDEREKFIKYMQSEYYLRIDKELSWKLCSYYILGKNIINNNVYYPTKHIISFHTSC